MAKKKRKQIKRDSKGFPGGFVNNKKRKPKKFKV